jgi:pimeloyl-ACP methyl ester carboxylesterase
MRNHGSSDHHKEHNYSVMADDIVRLLDKLKIDKVTLLGHSMGSKVVYSTACKYPEHVEGAISIDSVPKDYNKQAANHSDFVNTFVSRLRKYSIAGRGKVQLRKEMERMFNSKAVAKMMVNNMQFDSTKQCLGWKSNIYTILDNRVLMRGYEKLGEYKGHFLSLNAGGC